MNPGSRPVRRGLLGVIAVLVAGPALLSIHSRLAFGVWDPWSNPTRISYCGRTYDVAASGTLWARERATSGTDPGFRAAWSEVGRTDAFAPYYAMVVPDPVRQRFSPPLPCTMAVYLRLGDDAYLPYGLSGGP
jgi:hypothetical protein